MKAVILATAAFLAGASAQGTSQSKVNPPNHASPGPGTPLIHHIQHVPGGTYRKLTFSALLFLQDTTSTRISTISPRQAATSSVTVS